MGLDLAYCRGQGYDGASNMSGKCIGAAKLIQNDNEKAVFVHCASHRLNLCVAKSCDIPSIRKLFGFIAKTCAFVSFPKRLLLSQTFIKEKYPSEKRSRLINVCATRWIERINALEVFEDLFEPIMLSLDHIANNIDGTWSGTGNYMVDAEGIYTALGSFQSIMALVTSRRMLAYTRPTTTILQTRQMDFIQGHNSICLLKESLSEIRKNVNTYSNQFFEKAVELASVINIEPSIPRTCGIQRHRDNLPADNPQEFYRRSIFWTT